MKNQNVTKEQLINELAEMRQRIAELEVLKTKRERVQKYRKAQGHFSGIRNSSKKAIGYASTEGVLLDVNDSFFKLTGCSKEKLLAEKKYQDITPKEYRKYKAKIIEEILRIGEPTEYQKEYVRKDGSRVPILLTTFVARGPEGKPIGFVAIIKDITECKKMQEQLIRQEKLAVLGQLAGDVGHELRNPLGAIKNAAYFLKMALEKPEPEVKETLKILEKEVATSERIISSLLGFARPKPPTRRKVDINEIVQEALSRIRTPEHVEVVRKLDEALPAILADPNQLDQIFGNLILNAIQAMPEAGYLVIKSEVRNPGWVAISFADTGVGVPEDNLKRIFEPLFTTKAKGIGLGLALTITLVKQHGGAIEVESEAGKGSTFTVRLPIRGEEKK